MFWRLISTPPKIFFEDFFFLGLLGDQKCPSTSRTCKIPTFEYSLHGSFDFLPIIVSWQDMEHFCSWIYFIVIFAIQKKKHLLTAQEIGVNDSHNLYYSRILESNVSRACSHICSPRFSFICTILGVLQDIPVTCHNIFFSFSYSWFA